MFFEFAGPLLKMFVFWTNSSEVKCLAMRNRGSAMMRVTAVDSEVLVRVRELDMQVSTYLAILQVDTHVVSILPPNSRYLILGLQELSFKVSHEQVSI